MLNTPVTDGVDLFINIFVVIVGFVAALLIVDFKKTQAKNDEG